MYSFTYALRLGNVLTVSIDVSHSAVTGYVVIPIGTTVVPQEVHHSCQYKLVLVRHLVRAMYFTFYLFLRYELV
jgi:hypothetical protein